MTKTLAILCCLLCRPAAAFGQAAIAGSVCDPSGAAVPGVAIIATSDALIETTRTTITDNAGRYRIEDLRPGIYQLRFSLGGWKTYEQKGVELTGSVTAIVNAQLVVGAFTETISVSVEPPAVDVQSAKRAVTLTGAVVRSLPTARSYNALLALVPGVVTNVNDTVMGPATTSFPMHGGRQQEGRLFLDGLNIGSPPAGNSATTYDVDVGQAQEVTFTASGGLAEAETSGLVMNIIPKSGGNTMHGSVFASGTGERLQSNNLTPELLRQGVIAVAPYSKVYDVSATLGGSIVTDHLWYFLSAHTGGSTRQSTNVHYNRNAGDPGTWQYVPDVTRPAYSDRTFENVSGRLTWQVTPRNKVSGVWDAQAVCRSCAGATPGLSEPQQISPEAVGVLGRRLDVTQATWSSPLTDRLFLEAGYGGTFFGVGNFEREPNPTRDLVRVVEQCASGCAANGNIPGLTYRSQDFSVAHSGSYFWKGSVSYVTGSHSLKMGYQHTRMTDDRTWMTNNQSLTYRVDNGVPNQLTQSISPWVNDARAAWQAGFVQEQWTLGQVTFQGAARFDHAWSWFPAQQERSSRFLPTPIIVPKTRGIDSYKDVTPRFGMVYDVAGRSTTAIKISLGKFLESAGVSGIYANTNPTLRLPQTTATFGTAGVTRAWTDANSNFVPDCDLQKSEAQDLRASGGDFCGVLSNVHFGENVLTHTFDPRILSGWGVRPSDWNLALSIQQRIARRSLVDVTYTRRSFRGFTVADNLALDPPDLTPFSILAPRDSRLPGGGGYIIDGLYDVVPAKAGQVDNLVTNSTNYGRWSQSFSGLDVTVHARVGQSVTFFGGTSIGQTVADNCDVRANLPELATTTTGTNVFGAGLAGSAVTPLSPYCHVAYSVLTQVRGLSSYLVPKLDVQVAATFQSKPGAPLAANYAAPNSLVAPSLGRDLSANASNVIVNLIEPGSLYGDRINLIDLRFAKVLRFGHGRYTFGVDLYNVLNSNAVLTYNNTFVPGGPWLQPLTVLTPRLFKITAAVDW
jgi:Carboxypeptidase regulatory-like domain